jgi:hypothetical protein
MVEPERQRSRAWAGVGALALAAAAGMIGLQGSSLAPARAGTGVSGEGGEAVGLLSASQRSALKGALAAAKGARGRFRAARKKEASSVGGWSIEKMLKNGLDWDGKEGVKAGDDVIMVSRQWTRPARVHPEVDHSLRHAHPRRIRCRLLILRFS